MSYFKGLQSYLGKLRASIMSSFTQVVYNVLPSIQYNSPAELAVASARYAGLNPTGQTTMLGSGTYGAVFHVMTSGDDNRIAVKVFTDEADQYMRDTAAQLTKLASDAHIGPHFYGAFTDGHHFAMVMRRYDSDLHDALLQIHDEDYWAEVGQQVDDIMLRLAAVGWSCMDIKPENFVIISQPLEVRMIDFDLEFCRSSSSQTPEEVTKEYLKMKAMMDLVTQKFINNPLARMPGLFGHAYHHSEAFMIGTSYIHKDKEFSRVTNHYIGPMPEYKPIRPVHFRNSVRRVNTRVNDMFKINQTSRPTAGKSQLPSRNRTTALTRLPGTNSVYSSLQQKLSRVPYTSLKSIPSFRDLF